MKRDDNEQRATAVHQAGHAVAAVVLGRRFGIVDMSSMRKRAGRHFEHDLAPIPGADAEPNPQTVETDIVILLAGIAAEMKATGLDGTALSEREWSKRDLAEAEVLVPYPSERHWVWGIGEWGVQREASADRAFEGEYLPGLLRRSLEMWDKDSFRRAVLALAEELLQSGEVCYERARQIVEAALSGQPGEAKEEVA